MNKILIRAGTYLILIGICFILYKSNQSLRIARDNSIENFKAYESLYDSIENDNRVFKLSMDQLKISKDSIFRKMVEVQKQLKLKDKSIAQLQYRLSTIHKIDTITIKDTIFIDNFTLDTIIGDEWVTQIVHLKYPNLITIEPKIKLENYVLFKNEKETIKPRRKFFLWRLFQRKHIITEVQIVEKNKYVIDSISRFVIINNK